MPNGQSMTRAATWVNATLHDIVSLVTDTHTQVTFRYDFKMSFVYDGGFVPPHRVPHPSPSLPPSSLPPPSLCPPVQMTLLCA